MPDPKNVEQLESTPEMDDEDLLEWTTGPASSQSAPPEGEKEPSRPGGSDEVKEKVEVQEKSLEEVEKKVEVQEKSLEEVEKKVPEDFGDVEKLAGTLQEKEDLESLGLTLEEYESLPRKVKDLVQQQRNQLSELRATSSILQERKKELESTIGRQGRELGEARQYIKQQESEYRARIQEMDNQFMMQYAQAEAMAQRAEQEARDLEADGDLQAAQEKRMEAVQTRLQANSAQMRYESIRSAQDEQYARKTESAFLSTRPEYRVVKERFPDFCRELGYTEENIMAIRMNYDMMSKLYSILLDRERGKPDTFRRIVEKISKSKAEHAARVANAAQISQGVKAGPVPVKEEEEESWVDEIWKEPLSPDAFIRSRGKT